MKTTRIFTLIMFFCLLGLYSHAQITVTVNPNPTITFPTVTNPTGCSSTDGVIVASGAGVGGTYSWNTGATTASLSGLSGGTYTVDVTTAAGCIATATQNLVAPTAPTATLASNDVDNIVCAGTSVSYAITTAAVSPEYRFLVNGLEVRTWSSVAGADIYAYVPVEGDNVVGEVRVSGCTGVTTPIVMTVNALPIPTIVSQSNPTICAGNDGAITVGGGSSYLWNGGQTTASISGLIAGTYTCDVTNAAGCVAQIPVTLSDPGSPVVALVSSDADNTICAGTSVTFTASGATNYAFAVNGVVVQNSATATYTSTTLVNNDVVSVVGTTTGCSGSATPITMVVNALPVITFPTVVNSTDCSTPNGSIVASVTGSGIVYSWNTGATTASISGLASGTYTLNVVDGNACTAVASQVITAPGAPTVTLVSDDVDNTICAGTSVTFTASGATNYEFFVNSVSVQNGATATFTSTTLANGSIVSVVGTTTGCSASATPITMVVNAIPTATFSANVDLCGTGNIATLVVTPAGAVSPYTITMTNGTADLVAPNNAASVTGAGAATFTVMPTATTTYHYTVADSNGCVATY